MKTDLPALLSPPSGTPQWPRWLLVALGVGGLGLWLGQHLAFFDLLPPLLRGARVTLEVTLGAAVLAVAAALLAALTRLYAPRPLRWLAVSYIELFRGTSALVQLFWLFFVLPHFGISLPPMTVGMLALGLNVGAYGAEVVRAAINAVPRAQWEAAQALNLSRTQALWQVVLPQAFMAMIPPWGNLFIELLKASSLVSLITLADLSFMATQLNQNTLRTVEVFVLVLLIYLALSVLITLGMRTLERRATRGRRRMEAP